MPQTKRKLEQLEKLTRQIYGANKMHTESNFIQEQRIAANSPDKTEELEEARQGHADDATELLDYAMGEALTRKRGEFATRAVTEPHEWDERTETSLNCPCLSDIKSELDEGQCVALIYHTWMSEKNACISDVYDCFDDYYFTALVRAVVCSSPGQLDQVAARIRSKFSLEQDAVLEEIIDNYIANNF